MSCTTGKSGPFVMTTMSSSSSVEGSTIGSEREMVGRGRCQPTKASDADLICLRMVPTVLAFFFGLELGPSKDADSGDGEDDTGGLVTDVSELL